MLELSAIKELPPRLLVVDVYGIMLLTKTLLIKFDEKPTTEYNLTQRSERQPLLIGIYRNCCRIEFWREGMNLLKQNLISLRLDLGRDPVRWIARWNAVRIGDVVDLTLPS